MKKNIAVVLALICVLISAVGCTSPAPASSAAPAPSNASVTPAASDSAAPNDSAASKYTIAFTNTNDIYPYCIKLREFIKEFAAEAGMEVLVADAAGDVDKQNGQIDNFIVMGADLISAIPVDQSGAVTGLLTTKDAGKPYVALLKNVVDGTEEYDGYIYIGSENYAAGQAQGEYLASVLSADATILYCTGTPNSTQYTDRRAGLVDTLAAAGLSIASELAVDNQKDQALTATENWMQVYPKIDAIVCQNDDSALGAVEALKAAGRLDGVVVVGLDGNNEALESIIAGELSMSVLQDAYTQAKVFIDIVKQIRDGGSPADIDDAVIPYVPITKDNVNEYYKG